MNEKCKRIVSELTCLALTLVVVFLLVMFFRPVWMASGSANYFLLAVLVGFPFGIGKMLIFLPPASYGISGGLGVLALDVMIGGFIGCVCLAYQFITNLIRLITAIIA